MRCVPSSPKPNFTHGSNVSLANPEQDCGLRLLANPELPLCQKMEWNPGRWGHQVPQERPLPSNCEWGQHGSPTLRQQKKLSTNCKAVHGSCFRANNPNEHDLLPNRSKSSNQKLVFCSRLLGFGAEVFDHLPFSRTTRTMPTAQHFKTFKKIKNHPCKECGNWQIAQHQVCSDLARIKARQCFLKVLNKTDLGDNVDGKQHNLGNNNQHSIKAVHADVFVCFCTVNCQHSWRIDSFREFNFHNGHVLKTKKDAPSFRIFITSLLHEGVTAGYIIHINIFDAVHGAFECLLWKFPVLNVHKKGIKIEKWYRYRFRYGL